MRRSTNALCTKSTFRHLKPAYNKVNGSWCAENPYLLTETLRKPWGFRGFVISDWGSTYNTAATINAGMDLEMPRGEPMRLWAAPQTQRDGDGSGWLTADKVTAAVSAGQMTQGVVDESVRRILRVMLAAGLFDPHTGGGEVDTLAQRQVARTAANESIVLLKNSGLLPLNAERVRKIAVIGPNAAVARTCGGGNLLVRSRSVVTPLGIKEAAGARAEAVAWARISDVAI